MSRLSQFFWYINSVNPPDRGQEKRVYTGIKITPELRDLRNRYRDQLVGFCVVGCGIKKGAKQSDLD